MKQQTFLFSLFACIIWTEALHKTHNELYKKSLPHKELIALDLDFDSILDTTKLNINPQHQKRSLNYIYDNILSHTSNHGVICDGDSFYVCNNYDSEGKNVVLASRKLYIKQFNDIKNYTTEILTQSPNNHELKSLSVEKQLYQDCMKMGDRQIDVESQSFKDLAFRDLIDKVSSKSWLDIADELDSLAYGHILFDVSVLDDPVTSRRKILLLEPPTFTDIFYNVEEYIPKLKEVLNMSNEQEAVLIYAKVFLSQLSLAFPGEKYESFPEKNNFENMTLYNWYNQMGVFNDFPSEESSSKKIDWPHIFERVLKRQGYKTRDVSYILVKQQYFSELNKNLSWWSDYEKGEILAIKWIFDHMKYIDWNSWNKIHEEDKSSFCLHETKLYGASYEILRTIDDIQNLGTLAKTAREIIKHIVDIFNVDILISYNMTQLEKASLKNYLNIITSVLIDYEANENFVDRFYQDFHVTHNYLTDITNYRRKIHKKVSILRLLSSSPVIEPFSIIDLVVPQNRLILKTYFSSYQLISPIFHKEFHYGVYGTTMARFIYDLLNNKLLNTPEENKEDIDWLFTLAYHNFKKRMCFQRDGRIHNYHNMISEVYGLRTSYQAMLQHYLREEVPRRSFKFQRKGTFTSDAVFILSYLSAHCGEASENILFNFKEFPSAFGCNVNFKVPICEMKTF